jgi:hypothetical protein
LYAAGVFYALIFSKVHYTHKLLGLLAETGYIDRPTEGPLSFLGRGIFVFGLAIFVLVVFVPQILRAVRIKDGALVRCLWVSIVFWIFSALAWAGTKIEVSYLAYLIVYGAALGIIEGVYRVPIHPDWLDDPGVTSEGKLDMLKFEDNKWWRGLRLLWVIIIAIVVTGVINWVTSPSPGDETLRKLPAVKIQQAFILAFSSVPGIGLVVWNIIKRTNYIQEKLGELHKKA